jgi:hypothetical protein
MLEMLEKAGILDEIGMDTTQLLERTCVNSSSVWTTLGSWFMHHVRRVLNMVRMIP